MPASSSRSTYEEGARSEPPTSAPHAFATRASALIPAPPIPTNQKHLPSSKRDQLLRDSVRGFRLRNAQHGGAHLLEPAWVVEQGAHEVRRTAELGFRQHNRA